MKFGAAILMAAFLALSASAAERVEVLTLPPMRAAFTNEAGACFAALSHPAPAFLFDREWNLAKVTRRGVAPPGEWCRVDSDYRKLAISLR